MQTIPQLIKAIESILPPEVYVPLFVVIGVALVPTWFHWLRSKQIKGRIRRMLRATDPAEREAHRRAAFDLAAGKPRRLAHLADEALRVGLRSVYDEALATLKASGGHRADIQRLEGATKVVPPRGAHPLEEALAIERMVEAGLLDAARARLHEVRGRFPEDPDLAALQQRLDEASAPPPV